MQLCSCGICVEHLLRDRGNDMAIDMKTIREMAPNLCEVYDKETFVVMMKRRGLANIAECLDTYIDAGWIVPIDFGNKTRFHRGHMIILLRLAANNDLHYMPGLENTFDFEDIMSRRVFLCESRAKDIRDDAEKIQRLMRWIWSDNAASLDPIDAVLTKAIIDISLDDLDPDGFYENLKVDSPSGTSMLVKDLLAMQTEISDIITSLSNTGVSTPNVQYIFDRNRRFNELSSRMLPIHSPFLAIPTRDILADERLDFIRTRNELFADNKFQKLVEYYEAHAIYFESDIEKRAALSAAIGHIYGDLIKDSEKAAEAFQEALEYDPSNADAFQEMRRHLRDAAKWDDLIELLSNHWDTIDDAQKRCELILECAHIQAFKCVNVAEAIGLYERCAIEGYPGNDFDDLYKIVDGLMDEFTDTERLRAIVTLTLHIVNFAQCDKVEKLRDEFKVADDPNSQCISELIDSGLQSFKGDQPEALETLSHAIALAPRNTLIDALLYRIASKIHAYNEFREGMSLLETESLSSDDFSNIWVRVAKVLMRLPNHEKYALDYAEKAVANVSSNNEAIDLCYDLALKDGRTERAYIYATIKAARTKNDKLREELNNACHEMKLAFEDDDEKLMGVYETLLQFSDVQDDIQSNIRELINDLDTPKAIAFLQRIEPRCIASAMASFIGDLYTSILERNLLPEQKKNLLERYVGFLLGQDPSENLDVFVPIHAKLYAMAPSDRLFTMLKQTIKDDKDSLSTWAYELEDASSEVEDSRTLAKIYTTLASCYSEHALGDLDKEAGAYQKILSLIPDNVPAFKCCFTAFARIGRDFDCIEICKNFPIEKFTPQDRWNYISKALSFALIKQGDPEAMAQFLGILANDNEAKIPALIEELIKEAEADNIDKGQIICFFDTIAPQMPTLTQTVLKLSKANLLASMGDLDEVCQLLSRDTYEIAKQNKIEDFVKPAIAALANSDSDECKHMANLWSNASSPANKAVEKPATSSPANKAVEKPATSSPANKAVAPRRASSEKTDASIAALVKECAENIDDESFTSVIENAIKTLSPEDATILCIKLGKLYESKQNIQTAEAYFKRAFQLTQDYELLEFYKRIRHFKKALKILAFKLAKSPDAAKNSVKLETAVVYEAMRDFANALKIIDELLDSDAFDTPARIALMRQKSTYLLQTNDAKQALATLQQASAAADANLRDEIDTDIAFLLRESDRDAAQKLLDALSQRGVKSEKMTLLTATFDIDEKRYDDAEAKLTSLIRPDEPLAIAALEKLILLKQNRGDDDAQIREVARQLAERAPANAIAKQILEG